MRLESYSGKEFLLDLAATIKHHFPTFFEELNALPDFRIRKEYQMYEIVFGSLLIFLTRSGSRHQFDISVNKKMAQNIFSLFGVRLSIGDNLDKVISRLSSQCLEELKVKMVKHLIEKKRVDRLRFEDKFLIAFDGTGIAHYQQEPFEGCPFKISKNGKKIYYVQVLEAKLVGAGGWAISVASEFLHNGEDISEKNKQDCELKAFKRLAQKVKGRFKRLPLIVLADGLYANHSVFEICKAYAWDYLFTYKKGCIPQIHHDVVSILNVQKDSYERERLETKNSNTLLAQKVNYVTKLAYKKHSLHWIDFVEESRKEGAKEWKEENHFNFVTNLKLKKKNIFEVVATSRLRWTIENEGFNTQKNTGLNLEHKYARKGLERMKVYYQLLQISHLLEQLTLKRKAIREKVKEIKVTVKQLFKDMVAVLRHELLSVEEIKKTELLKKVGYG